jgi:molecular chaperone DnaK
VQVSFDIDANGLLQVSATDRTTGRQQSVSIQGGSNLSEQEIEALLAEAERKSAEDRRRRAEVDRRNRAQTLIAQAERRLRDVALELGPYGAERQQRAVELAVRDVQDLLARGESAELDLAVSQLQEALFGLNRRLLQERRSEAGPLQGLRNTLGSLKDELFADDDDWDDWDRGRRPDPWQTPAPASPSGRDERREPRRSGWSAGGDEPGWRDPERLTPPWPRQEREPSGRRRPEEGGAAWEPRQPSSGRRPPPGPEADPEFPPSRRRPEPPEPGYEPERSGPATDPGRGRSAREQRFDDDPWRDA